MNNMADINPLYLRKQICAECSSNAIQLKPNGMYETCNLYYWCDCCQKFVSTIDYDDLVNEIIYDCKHYYSKAYVEKQIMKCKKEVKEVKQSNNYENNSPDNFSYDETLNIFRNYLDVLELNNDMYKLHLYIFNNEVNRLKNTRK